ncbi:O-antigen ligase family protein [Bradyrhizobium sp. AUGA SZCCT0274]|uniref:O-antigen ligase family protein n=1 Tax=Bradyrhizobium sp. AUGA SZCCT0274 TaxID=2807670 RepID=UPI001BA4962D|nr:O-antigen ligase family protein [Bradyrhizobium sp. AUGA SZCCT0274]MBR1244218.1 O-antigen ligase family protein [Bradyrhizobium sp. AUGA SZCCT0274]
MLATLQTHGLAKWTAIAGTMGVFAKTFIPFYLIGSTAIFAALAAIGCALVAMNWRQILKLKSGMANIGILIGLFYTTVIISFLLNSLASVPLTHLLGILIFHTLFVILGFAASCALRWVFWILVAAGAVYLIFIAQYVVRFGDLMRDGFIHDVFGVGDSAIYLTFHQNIGVVLGFAALAALGLSSNRTTRILAFSALPLVLLFLFHVAARGALVALLCSLLFLAAAALWVRSPKLVAFGVIAAAIVVVATSSWFYQRALGDRNVNPNAGDALSRTIREIQDPRPGFRMQIWARTAERISAEPNRLLFGRGIGMFPVNDGFGAPDWLLRKAEGSKHYPHNVHLELLYETGIVGLLLFSIVTLFPLAASLSRWSLFSSAERSAIALYVFYLVSSGFSGAFAYSYQLQFFFGLAVGVIAIKRSELAASLNPRILTPANHGRGCVMV